MIEFVVVETPRDLLGTVVIPKCGRDAGRPHILIGWHSGERALIADGRIKNTAKPKKKNIKHIHFTMCRPGELRTIVCAGEQITDRTIREGLAVFGELEEEGRHYGQRRRY